MTHRAGFTYFFFPKNPLRDRYRELGIDRIDTMSADEMLQKLGDAAARVPARNLVRIFDRDRPARPHHRARHQEAAGRRRSRSSCSTR